MRIIVAAGIMRIVVAASVMRIVLAGSVMRIVLAASVVLLQGCELLACSGPEYLSFGIVRHGMLPSGSPTFSSSAPLWGASETMKPTDEIRIIYPEDDTLPADALELFAGDGTPVAFAGRDAFVDTNGEACAHNERTYALDALAVGDYTLLHRRANGTGDPLNCAGPDCPWTTIDGSVAVSLVLSIR